MATTLGVRIKTQKLPKQTLRVSVFFIAVIIWTSRIKECQVVTLDDYCLFNTKTLHPPSGWLLLQEFRILLFRNVCAVVISLFVNAKVKVL